MPTRFKSHYNHISRSFLIIFKPRPGGVSGPNTGRVGGWWVGVTSRLELTELATTMPVPERLTHSFTHSLHRQKPTIGVTRAASLVTSLIFVTRLHRFQRQQHVHAHQGRLQTILAGRSTSTQPTMPPCPYRARSPPLRVGSVRAVDSARSRSSARPSTPPRRLRAHHQPRHCAGSRRPG